MYHYGLGFLISPKLLPFATTIDIISNIVVSLDIKMIARNGSISFMRVVNAYGPTMGKVKGNKKLERDSWKYFRSSWDT